MKKLLWIALPIAVLFTGVIIGVPIATERYAERWLRDQGVIDADIDDVDFNPFSGVLRTESVSMPGSAGEKGKIGLVEVNYQWTSLLPRRLLVSSVTISTVQIDIQKHTDGSFTFGGLQWPLIDRQEQDVIGAAESDGEEWGFGLRNVAIDNVVITYRDDSIHSEIELNRLVIDSLATWEPETITRLDAELRLDGAEIALRIDAKPFSAEPQFGSTLAIDRLALEKYSQLFQSAGIEKPQGSVSLDLETTVDISQNGAIHIDNHGTVELNNLAALLASASVQSEQLTWTGQISASLSNDAQSVPDLSGTNNLRIVGLTIDHRDQPIHLTAFEEMVIQDAKIDGLDLIHIKEITMQALQLLRRNDEDTSVVSIGSTAVNNIELVDQTILSVDDVQIDTAIVDIEREKSGAIKLVSEAVNDFTRPPADDPDDQADAMADEAIRKNAFRFHVNRLEIAGQSGIHFNDLAVVPPLSTRFVLNTVKLSDFGNIDPIQPAHLVLDVQQEDAASFVFEGDFQLFDEQISGDLTLAVKRFDLTQISSYLPGYDIQRGRLSLDSRAKLVGDELAVENTVLVERLSLSGKAAGDKDLLGKGMAMPLDVALDLLRDSDDRIKLELPISGSLKDPKFGTGDIVRTAMQGAMQKAAMSYVKNALQPLGTIMLVAKVAGQAARPRFEPVEFEPGNAQLTSQSQAYLDKIAKLLQERPGLSITFCGVSTQEDRAYFVAQVPLSPENVPEETLEPPKFETEQLELAKARGGSLQDYLTRKHAVDSERLFRCRPTVEAEGDLGPRAEITI